MSEFYRSIYWIKDEARLKNYSVSKSKGGKATIRLEIEVTDTLSLGLMMSSLDNIDADQAADETARKAAAQEAARAAKAEERAARAAARTPKKIGKAQELLQLTYRSGE